MRKELQQKAKVVACGIGMGALLALPAVSVLPGVAGADNTCYTGCTAASGGVTDANGQGLSTPTSSPGSLAFTGADLGEMALIGVGAVAAGTVLVRRSHRRTA
ncbi:MAG TPA: hypothetical protein VND70_06880 [Acidimicrobiales bacterium]|nr:hypothetical protein [Acidimicrobiales bacterium]